MGCSSSARPRRILATAGALAALWLAAACGGSQKKSVESAPDQEAGPPPCKRDEVREYFCDDLLPFNSDKAAPAPYHTCPSTVGVKGNVFAPTSRLARFDVPRTEWTRKRVPPGHACCYSWCATLVLADVDLVDTTACQQPNAMPERMCISTAEAGVSEPAAAPNEQCAVAVTPPPGVAFTPPKAAALDLQATSEKRNQGVSECCYGWCSKAPLGTGLGSK